MMGQKITKGIVVVGFSLLISISFLSSSALAVENFPYEDGDVITITVPFKPGGGFDTYARLLAPQLEKALETIGGANVSVIVKNVTGAGGRAGHEAVFRAKPDGRTLLIAHEGSMPYYVLLYNSKIKIGEYTWLAAIASGIKGIVVRSDIPVNNLMDLIKRSQKIPTLMAGSGKGDDPHIDPLLIAAILREEGIEWKMDFVQFHGTAPARASIARKETEALFTAAGSMLPIVDSGDAKFIVIFAEERDTRAPDSSTVIEQKIPRGKEMIDAISLTWSLVGPPGIPEITTEILRVAAFMAINGTEFRTRAAKAKRTVNYLPGLVNRQIALGKLETIKKYLTMIKKEMGIQ